MGEHDALEALGVSGEWIWGNDVETVVFAQAFGHGKTLIFQFMLDSEQHTHRELLSQPNGRQYKYHVPESTVHAHSNMVGDCYSLDRV